jgi:hypothetical protein
MAVGGKRKGSGRPKGTSRYKEDTKPIRIPLTLIPLVTLLLGYVEKGSKANDIEEIFSGVKSQKNCVNAIKRNKK